MILLCNRSALYHLTPDNSSLTLLWVNSSFLKFLQIRKKVHYPKYSQYKTCLYESSKYWWIL